jgi:hypothetical protein
MKWSRRQKKMRKSLISAIALLLIVAPAILAQRKPGPKIGDQAPEITVEEWVNRGEVNLAQFKREGKVTVLEFWATW